MCMCMVWMGQDMMAWNADNTLMIVLCLYPCSFEMCFGVIHGFVQTMYDEVERTLDHIWNHTIQSGSSVM